MQNMLRDTDDVLDTFLAFEVGVSSDGELLGDRQQDSDVSEGVLCDLGFRQQSFQILRISSFISSLLF